MKTTGAEFDLNFENICNRKNTRTIKKDDKPRLIIVDDFLSIDTCKEILSLSKNFLGTGATGYNSLFVAGYRTSTGGSDRLINIFLEGEVVDILYERIGAFLRIPRVNFPKDIRVRIYSSIDGDWHYDTGRNAFATALIYLNSICRTKGGATEYLDIDRQQTVFRVFPKEGKLSVHMNLDCSGNLISKFMHRSSPLFDETKFVLAIPIRNHQVYGFKKERDYSPVRRHLGEF